MNIALKAGFGLALLAGLGLTATRPAAASHEEFQNVTANGVALTPTVDDGAAVNVITLIGNTVTFTTDYHSNYGQYDTDNLYFQFTQTGGTTAAPTDISPTITFSPDTQTLTEMFSFSGPFVGDLSMHTGVSYPDYSSPAQGYNFGGADFLLNVLPAAPAPAAVPEPSSVASMGLGGVGLLGLLLRARKRRTAA